MGCAGVGCWLRRSLKHRYGGSLHETGLKAAGSHVGLSGLENSLPVKDQLLPNYWFALIWLYLRTTVDERRPAISCDLSPE